MAADDARSLEIFPLEDLSQEMAFNHAGILADCLKERRAWLANLNDIRLAKLNKLS